MSYLEVTHHVYKQPAITPDIGLCCTTNPVWELPGLKIPQIMQEMNYGCGSTVHAHQPVLVRRAQPQCHRQLHCHGERLIKLWQNISFEGQKSVFEALLAKC